MKVAPFQSIQLHPASNEPKPDAEYRIGADQSGYGGTILQRPRSTGGAIAPMTLNLEWAAWATLLVGDSSGH